MLISFIKGVAKIFSPNTILIINNGIGYKVFVTDKVLEHISKTSLEIEVYTYMNIKQDEISLFGFLLKEELDIFEKLILVSGVGPKSAISLLNAMSFDELMTAIMYSDTKKLAKGVGIGSKTAQRIVLELKDKIFDKAYENTLNYINNNETDIKKDAIEALLELGFSKSEVILAIDKIQEDLPLDKIISKALKLLSK